jgi:Sugar (and other) transporter
MAALSLILMIWIPESPRWLISKGKYKQALAVYKHIAKLNGRTFSDMLYKLPATSPANTDPNIWLQMED